MESNVSGENRSYSNPTLTQVETDARLSKKRFLFFLVNFSFVTLLLVADSFNQATQSTGRPTGELVLACLLLFICIPFLVRSRISTAKFLSTVANSIRSGQGRSMLITAVHQYTHKGSIIDCWVELKEPNSTVNPVIMKIDRGYNKSAVEGLVCRYLLSQPSFTPVECRAYVDSKSNQVMAIDVDEALIKIKKGGVSGLHNSLMGTQSAERARRFLDRVAAVAQDAQSSNSTILLEEPDKQQMTQLLIDSQRDGAVVVSAACAAFIAVGAGLFFFCLMNESIPLVLRHIILWPLGLVLLFVGMVPLLSVNQLSEAERIARITEQSTPKDVMLTKVFATKAKGNKSNKSDDYWIEYRTTNLGGSPEKRVKLELFNIVGQRDFIEGLSRECAVRQGAEKHVLVPAKVYFDPETQEPVAVVIDGLLFPFDRTSFTAACTPSQRFPLF